MEHLKAIIEALLLGLSLSADCFAVSLCSSVGLKAASRQRIAGLAATFAVIQSGLLLAGWLLGHLFRTFFESRLSHFETICSVTAFILLMFVAVEMFLSALRGKTEKINLSSTRNIILGAVATSIDALSVGISLALSNTSDAVNTASGSSFAGMLLPTAAVFVTTALAVVAGILSGSSLGRGYGRGAVFAGSAILAIIAVINLL